MQILLDLSFIILKYIYLFFLGASLGSFYKTIYDRILYFFYSNIRKQFTLKQKYYHLFFQSSFCYNCKKPIKKLYLIPIIGFFLTKGKCNNCQIPLSKEFLFWEIAGGTLLCYFYYFLDILSFIIIIILFHFYISALIDFKKFFLDYENMIFLYIFGLIYNILQYDVSNLNFIFLRMMILILFFFILYILGRGKQLGFGDLILVGAIGLIFDILEIIIIINLGAIGSILYIILYKKNKKAYAPLGFFLSMVSIIVLIFKPFY